jgi:hypothetical protein
VEGGCEKALPRRLCTGAMRPAIARQGGIEAGVFDHTHDKMFIPPGVEISQGEDIEQSYARLSLMEVGSQRRSERRSYRCYLSIWSAMGLSGTATLVWSVALHSPDAWKGQRPMK